MTVSVCLSVCLSVRKHISGTTCPTFTKFCARVICDRGSVLLRFRHSTIVARSSRANGSDVEQLLETTPEGFITRSVDDWIQKQCGARDSAGQ